MEKQAYREANRELTRKQKRESDYRVRNGLLRQELTQEEWDYYCRARRVLDEFKRRHRDVRGTCTVEQLQARWEVYGGLCWLCGEEADTVDHVIPLALGGTDWPANLRPACRSCNSRKRHSRNVLQRP